MYIQQYAQVKENPTNQNSLLRRLAPDIIVMSIIQKPLGYKDGT